MGRPLRHDPPGGWHHVMNRGIDHGTVFASDHDRNLFEHLLGTIASERRVEVHAYCLMGNHYHLLLHCPDGQLSTTMQQLASSFTRIVNERLGRDGPLFRGRFHSITIHDERQLVATVAYIHRNPVDIVPVGALAAYRWSSFGPYVGARTAPSWLVRSSIGALLDADAHRALVLADPPRESGTSNATPPTSGGDVPPIERIDVAIGAAMRDRERFVGIAPSARDLKALRLVVAGHDGERSAERLAQDLGMPSPGAARTALTRARRVISGDAELARLANRIVTEIHSAV